MQQVGMKLNCKHKSTLKQSVTLLFFIAAQLEKQVLFSVLRKCFYARSFPCVIQDQMVQISCFSF